MSLYQYFYSGIPNWFKMYLSSLAAAPLLSDQDVQLGSGFFSLDLEGLVALTATSLAAQADRVGLESTSGWFLLKKDWVIEAAGDRSHVHNSQDHLLRWLSLLFLWGCRLGLLLLHKFWQHLLLSLFLHILYLQQKLKNTRCSHFI